MIRTDFKRANLREILELQGIDCPRRLDKSFFSSLIEEGKLLFVGDSYENAVKSINNLKEGSVALFPNKFRFDKEKADREVKSLEGLVKIDSAPVLRKVSGQDSVPHKLTKSFLEEYQILPEALIQEAVNRSKIENPPRGIYWIGRDNHVRAFTWLRAISGIEMQIMNQLGKFFGEVKDKKPYGRNIRVGVGSREKPNLEYEFSLFRLPIFSYGDKRKFSEWTEISHNSNDPDASYRGGEHDKRVFPFYFWSAPSIFAYYNSMSFVSNMGGNIPDDRRLKFRVNPFPIPKDKRVVDFIDRLRFQSLIIDSPQEDAKKLKLSILSNTEIEELIGTKLILEGYDNFFYHLGKKNLDYLYNLK
ncbi:hypothetical protein K0A97_00310 [Patescibacteria group bacterium]|nr:hypothetical protein [Patescibacteria group bacterium]